MMEKGRAGVGTVLVWFLLSIGSVATTATVEPDGMVPEHELIRVYLDEGERAWILSSRFTSVSSEQLGQLIVWTGPPGRYVILSWTETGQAQQFVEIGGAEPEPEPTPPPPDPDPGPDPPGPDPQPPVQVLNEFGIGHAAYVTAMKVGRPQEAVALGRTVRKALAALVQGRTTPAGAEALIRNHRSQLQGDWTEWEVAVERQLREAIQEHGGGALQYRNYLLEIATGLEAAGSA